MDAEIRNAQGEKLDYCFHAAAGESPFTVIIGHGVTANKDRPFVVALATGLAMAGVPSLRFSFSGNGASEGRFEDSCITKEVEDLGAVIDVVHGQGRRIVYIGHSMGGAVGVKRTAADPRIEFLVSLAGMVHTKKFAEVEFGEETPGEGYMWGKEECPLSQTFVDDMNSIDSVLDLGSQVKVPWFLVHGIVDDVVPIEESREIFSLANDPKDLLEIKDCDHVFDPETDPDSLPTMVSAVSAWLMPRTMPDIVIPDSLSPQN
ncbi:MAG: alpha/beta hydrolase [Verrucomicrobiota bacterium]|nr:alpha/beta hydrolase [Verrucomicrobiota bacterium]